MENQYNNTPTDSDWKTSLFKAAAWIVLIIVLSELLWGFYDPMINDSAIRQVVVASWILIFLGSAITGLLIHISIQLSTIISQGNRRHQETDPESQSNHGTHKEEA